MDLASYTRPDLILYPLPATDAETVLRAFAERLKERGVVADADELYRRLADREKLGSTGIGAGVAVPHCKLEGLEAPLLAVGLTEKPGVDFAAVDDKPVRLFFTVISPDHAPAEHLRVLATVSRWVQSSGKPVARLMACKRPESILSVLSEVRETVGAGAESG